MPRHFLMNRICIPIFFLTSSLSWGLDLSCVQTEALNGADCNHVAVHFDFSKCAGEAPKSQTVRSRCVNGKAVAFVKTPMTLIVGTFAVQSEENGKWRYLSLREQNRPDQKQSEAPATTSINSEVLVPSGTDLSVTLHPKKEAETPEKRDEIIAPKEAKGGDHGENEEHAAEHGKTQFGWPNGLQISGFLDLYYSYNGNAPSAVTAPSATSASVTIPPAGNNTYRFFDVYHDTVNVSLAELTFKKKFENATAQVDLGFGNFVSIYDPNDFASQNITRAFVTWELAKNLNLRVGKMFSHLGLEDPYTTENSNYSESFMLYSAIPAWATGAALDWSFVPKAWTLSLIVNNNGGNSIYTRNQTHTLGARLEYQSDNFRGRYNFQSGTDSTAYDNVRTYHEVNFKWNFVPHLKWLVDSIVGFQPLAVNNGSATWSTTYVGLEWHDGKWFFTPRYEYFSDPQGYSLTGLLGATNTFVSQNVSAGTLTLAYEFAEGAKVIGEIRQDTSDHNVFANTTSQTTATVASIIEF